VRGPDDVLAVASRTLVREAEAEALAGPDLRALAGPVRRPALFLRGTASPAWAAEVTQTLAELMAHAPVICLPGAGHEGVHTAAEAVAEHLDRFLRH
jgi:pimeloyl-ACP methyl ester carboxylesterase